MTFHTLVGRPLVLMVTATGLAACQPALIYGERTSFNLAAVQVNDNVSEPVRINFGLLRSVATAAPPRGGMAGERPTTPVDPKSDKKTDGTANGEAVSVLSNFHLEDSGAGSSLPLVSDELTIRTRFASGEAAISVADKPGAVRAILGVGTVGPVSPEIRARQKKLVDCVRKIVDPKQLEVIAKELGVESTDNPQADNFEIRNRIGEKRPPELDRLESILKITCV